MRPTISVPHDLQCLRCHYNLRGLNINGRCPECDYRIGKSLAGNAPWSIGLGLRRAVLYELRWGALCFVALTAILWLASPLFNFGPRLSIPLGLGAAFPVCWLLWHRLVEAAGFLSAILVVVGSITITLAALGSAALVSAAGPVESAPAFGFGAGLCVASVLWIIYDFQCG